MSQNEPEKGAQYELFGCAEGHLSKLSGLVDLLRLWQEVRESKKQALTGLR